jgi:hypothetical protein
MYKIYAYFEGSEVQFTVYAISREDAWSAWFFLKEQGLVATVTMDGTKLSPERGYKQM